MLSYIENVKTIITTVLYKVADVIQLGILIVISFVIGVVTGSVMIIMMIIDKVKLWR